MAMVQLYEFGSYRIVGKLTCPSCGRRKCFVPYVWKGTNKIVRSDLGRCDHESSCGCHNKPWELPRDEQEELKRNQGITPDYVPPPPPPPKPFIPLSGDYVRQMSIVREKGKGLELLQSNLTDYMVSLPFMDLNKLTDALIKYYIGITRWHEIIYWQVDTEHKVHSGKIMKYFPNGHRFKVNGQGFLSWVHFRLDKQGMLPEGYNLQQCLFGLHLLSRKENDNKPIAIVESEKSATFCSIFHPKFIWMACGSLSNLNIENLQPLIKRKRRIYLFPDIDGWDKWNAKCIDINKVYYNICIHSSVKKHYNPLLDPPNADILDITLREQAEEYAKTELQPTELTKCECQLGIEHNSSSALVSLFKNFDLMVL